jgi:hypothetical protein
MAVKNLIAAAASLALLGAGAAHAATWVASSTGGSNGPLSAQADITVSNNQLVISLTDLLANPTSAGQEVSGVQIFLASDPTKVTYEGGTGTLINITSGSHGAANTWTYDTKDSISDWGAVFSSTNHAIYLAAAGTGAPGGKPGDLIIDNGGVYSNANPSITGHGPEIKGTGVFTLGLQGEPLPIITGVKIEFGTSPDTTLTATCSLGCSVGEHLVTSVPEPAVWGMMIGGFFGAGVMLRSRRRRMVAA